MNKSPSKEVKKFTSTERAVQPSSGNSLIARQAAEENNVDSKINML